MPRKPPPTKLQLTSAQLGLEKEPSFTHDLDGSFVSEDGLVISSRGIVQTPSSCSSTSSSTPGSRSFATTGITVSGLDELEPLHQLGAQTHHRHLFGRERLFRGGEI